MTYQSFANKWLGKRVDVDKQSGYQCTDLTKQYLKEEHGLEPGKFGNAIDWWYHTAAPVLGACDKIHSLFPKQGDIVVLETNKTPIVAGSGEGHIGIATGESTANTVEILEQNGATGSGNGLGGNAIRTRFIPRQRIAGTLRPKVAVHIETVKPVTWNVRAQPTTDSRVVAVVKGGEQYQTELQPNGWRKVESRGGYVSGSAWVV